MASSALGLRGCLLNTQKCHSHSRVHLQGLLALRTSTSRAVKKQSISPRSLARCVSPTCSSTDSEDDQRKPTVRVQVDVGEAIEVITVPLQASGNSVLTVDVQLPLGLTFEVLDDNCIVVEEIDELGNASALGVQVGDMLRGTTAVAMQMTYPTVNLMFGGVGRPAMKKILFAVEQQPFDRCMDAIRSNTEMDSQLTLVLERIGGSAAQHKVDVFHNALHETGGRESTFDPSIFD